ncbi:hypothetical protein ACS0TY_021029 [Phlomoides rotata]
MNASDGTHTNENNPNLSRSNDQQKGKGRKKLVMEKIKNEKNLQVTFSKRCAGVFKKASELNTLCDAKSVVVVFTPGKRAHSYGHPKVETIANMFLNTSTGPTPPTNPLIVAHHKASNCQLNQELVHLEELLVRERHRKSELNHTFKPCINEMNYEELNQLKEFVLGFKSAFESRLKESKSLGGLANDQGTNPEQGGPNPSIGFINTDGFNMMGYPNVAQEVQQTSRPNPEQDDPSSSVGFNMMGYPNTGDPTH